MEELSKVLAVIFSFWLLYSNIHYGAQAFQESEQILSDQILMILEHYKQENPVGIPGLSIEDPMSFPDIKQVLSLGKIECRNIQAYGTSKFTILYLKSEISTMKVMAGVMINNLHVIGNYTLSTWLSHSKGPFSFKMSDVYVEGIATLAVERDGLLRAQELLMDIKYDKMEMKFENMLSVFQGIVSSLENTLFDYTKPFILKKAYDIMRPQINTHLENVAGDMRFSSSIPPLDVVIAETRKHVQEIGFDPFFLRDHNENLGPIHAKLTHTWITGISSFYRVGNISLSIENHTIIADFNVGTKKVKGQTQWDIWFLGGIISRSGFATFSIEYINVRIVLAQPLDVRKHPEFRNLQLELGNVQARCDGTGTLDYVIEFIVNILPNILRDQIMDAIEHPIRNKVQQYFNSINIENLIKSKVVDADKMKIKKYKITPTIKIEKPLVEESNSDFWRFEL